jgi:hypothetical protein
MWREELASMLMNASNALRFHAQVHYRRYRCQD